MAVEFADLWKQRKPEKRRCGNCHYEPFANSKWPCVECKRNPLIQAAQEIAQEADDG